MSRLHPLHATGRTRPGVILLLIAVALAAGLYGGYQLATWHHTSRIDASLREFAPLIRKHAARHDVPVELVTAVIRAESGGDPSAVSSAGAKGLMQLTPPAEKDVLEKFGYEKGGLFDPDYNIAVGTAYLGMLLERFDGDRWLAVAAYNAGPGRISKLRQRHPDLSSRQLVLRHAPRETASYASTILD